jgi:glutamine synthetase
MTSILKQKADELGIKYFLVSFSDLLGTLRAKLVPAATIATVSEGGAGFAGFATWLDMTPADPDMFAVPDPDSLVQLPWKPEIGWLAADLYMNGKLVEQAPRSVLKASLARAKKLGYEMRTGVECEYFIVTPDGAAIADGNDRQTKPCYDQQALMRRYDLISEICDCMLQLGWEPYQNDHEDANGQFEMNWSYAGALQTADRQTFFKYMVKTLAEKHGLRATFMPKPFAKLTGNGCHVHVSLWDRERNVNLFKDESNDVGLSPLAYHFIGGVIHSASALCAFTNPSVNSYRRINAQVTDSGATWSPNAVSYSGNNRTHMIRIPEPGRFELRLPDGSANPYLLAASILEAGLDGITNKRDPGKRLDVNLYRDREQLKSLDTLPDNLLDALRALEGNEVLREGLGQSFAQSYLKLKHAVWREYTSHVSAWEVEQTLDC